MMPSKRKYFRLKRFATIRAIVWLIMVFDICSASSLKGQVKIEYFVSTKGNDNNSGTIKSPFQTVEKAKSIIRKLNKSGLQGKITVYLHGGTYSFHEALNFDVRDGGNEHLGITYKAFKNEHPVFQGGRLVENSWGEYKNGIYFIHCDSVTDMRQLYVDGKRMIRATTTPMKGGWTKDENGIIISADKNSAFPVGKCIVEFVQETGWRLLRIKVDSILAADNQYIIHFEQPNWNYFHRKAKLSPWVKPDIFFTIENSLSFLDEENEWYFDRDTKILYLKLSSKTNLDNAEVFIPQLERFIEIDGSSAQNKLKNLHFEGITFQHSGYLKPNLEGSVPMQSTILVEPNGDSGRIPGCISINFADNITFVRNRFEHLGATALYLENGITNINISGNIFSDISASAIDLGNIINEEPVNKGLQPINIEIANNVLRDIAIEYSGSAAISAYYIAETNISHNDIDGCGYSGVSTGWGWSEKATSMWSNRVDSNRIFNVMKRCWDGSPVYTLSNQPHSGLTGNYVGGLNLAQHGSAGLYHDQGSAGFTDENNVIEVERPDLLAYMLNDSYGNTVRNIYSNNGNTVVYFYDYHKPQPNDINISNFHISPERNWPEPALKIISNAGLEKEYRDLLTTVRPAIPIYFEEQYFESPILFESGKAIVEAENYTKYIGLEHCNYSWIGVKAWFTGYSGTRALMAVPSKISDQPKYTEMPMLGYNLRFDKPGDYYVFIRAKGDKDINSVNIGFDGQESGKMEGWAKDFSWQKPLKIIISKPGIHQIIVWMKTESFFIDKIMLSEHENEMATGSKEFGPDETGREITIPKNALYYRFRQ